LVSNWWTLSVITSKIVVLTSLSVMMRVVGIPVLLIMSLDCLTWKILKKVKATLKIKCAHNKQCQSPNSMPCKCREYFHAVNYKTYKCYCADTVMMRKQFLKEQ
jgi:hypothetical protein